MVKKRGVVGTEGVPSLCSAAKPRSSGYLRGRDTSCDYLKACFLDGGPGRNLLEAVEGVESAAGWEHRLLGHLLPRTHTRSKESSLCLLFIFISSLCILNKPGTGLKKQTKKKSVQRRWRKKKKNTEGDE